MGVYTYTLRTKTQNLELPGGEVVVANVMAYLCRSNDHDMTFMWPGDYGYKEGLLLNAAIERCQDRFWNKGEVYIIHEDSKQGYEVYKAEDAHKACVWYDCDAMTSMEGVTLVGRLGSRVRRGRKLVWTVMADDEAEAFDKAEEEKRRAERAEQKRKRILARVKAYQEKIAQRQREAQDASLNSAGL